MIVYNNRYRGPFEYDKYCANALSLHNIIRSIEKNELSESNEHIKNLIYMKSEVDNAFNFICGENGTSEKIHSLILARKGGRKIL